MRSCTQHIPLHALDRAGALADAAHGSSSLRFVLRHAILLRLRLLNHHDAVVRALLLPATLRASLLRARQRRIIVLGSFWGRRFYEWS